MDHYVTPQRWTAFDFAEVAQAFVDAKSAVRTLKALPFQRDWVKDLERTELRREVAGTTRIEGADFTERELDEALKESPEELLTRSQRQAHAAAQTFRWIASLSEDLPITENLVLDIHRRMVTGADDDRSPPGKLRGKDENVNFGSPRRRGAEGGEPCAEALRGLVEAIDTEFQSLDPQLRGFAAHYHLAAMHPFLDGNGRTARALGLLLHRRAGLRDICFVSMSNFYSEEKAAYLDALNQSWSRDHELTAFLNFGLKGLALQAERLTREIRENLAKTVYRDLMYDLFLRLESTRKKVIGKRQLEILKILLETGRILLDDFFKSLLDSNLYGSLKNPSMAGVRDFQGLINLGAIEITHAPDGTRIVQIRLSWPEEITSAEFCRRIKEMPKAKNLPSLR